MEKPAFFLPNPCSSETFRKPTIITPKASEMAVTTLLVKPVLDFSACTTAHPVQPTSYLWIDSTNVATPMATATAVLMLTRISLYKTDMHHMNHFITILTLLVLSLCSACGSLKSVGSKPYAVDTTPPKGPHNYQQGWKDGCESGISSTNTFFQLSVGSHQFVLHNELRADKLYNQAWRYGFNHCGYAMRSLERYQF